jgi:hypothetical protein
MKKILALVAVAGVAGAANAQDLIAYWNFNTSTAGTSGGLGTVDNYIPGVGFPSDFGNALITTNIAVNTVAGTTGVNNGDVGTFGGDTLNALFGDVSGGALAVRSSDSNGSSIVFEFDASDYTGISISWAGRGTGTGFGSASTALNTIQWSTDGVNFTTFGQYESRQTNFILYSFGAGSNLDFADNAFIRIVFDGATSTGGNNRLDNIQITGTFIPAPGAFALLGLGGLAAARRRR